MLLTRNYVSFLFIAFLLPSALAKSPPDIFRFHVSSEPASLDPSRLESSEANYLFHNLYRGLYRWSSSAGLVADGARECSRPEQLRIVCTLDPAATWSDGVGVEAEHYVRAFRHLVAPTSKSLGVELLGNVVGALEAFSGKMPVTRLGVTALGRHRLEIRLKRPDPDFLYKLTSPLLVPIRSERFPERDQAAQHIYNGPYQIEAWEIGKRIRLRPNPRYLRGAKTRPKAEVLIIDEDATALTLYENGRLTFLRRLPSALIAKYKARPDFKQVPVARFDYIGFGPEMKTQPRAREALALSLDFEELRRVYDALGVPGCPSLPEHYMDEVPCLRLDAARAKRAWSEVPREFRDKRRVFAFSKLGGDDTKKAAEWAQQQWSRRLEARVDLQQTEQALFLRTLRESAPPIFRKGVGLDRPTCLAALETFAAGGAENFLRLEIPAYQGIIERLHRATTEMERKRLCTEGIRLLIADHWLIPLGRIHFSLLASPAFTGWTLNDMNQLDLAELRSSR